MSLPHSLPLTLALTFSLSALFYTSASAHGMMCIPRQRGAYHSQKCLSDLDIPPNPVTDFCAHCLNGGTVATVKAHLEHAGVGWTVYDPVKLFDKSTFRAGLCGDPKGQNHHMIGGDFMPYEHVPIVDHYKTAGEVDFMAEIDTNHNGYFEFFLCDIDACATTDISPDCFKSHKCHKLERVPHPDCENPNANTHYECGPIDHVYPGRWYLPCRNTGHVGVHIVGGPTGTMRYKLPEGVECEHCVVQWYWATANSCAPRGVREYIKEHNYPFGRTCESDGGGKGTYREGMAVCGGDAVPEEFWSCADVQVTRNGKSAGPVRAIPDAKISPPPTNADDMEVKNDPQKVVDKASEELEKDINQEAHERPGERKREERRAAKGQCMADDAVCDGTVPCCDKSSVCVYTIPAGQFTCRLWWKLWDERNEREKLAKAERAV